MIRNLFCALCAAALLAGCYDTGSFVYGEAFEGRLYQVWTGDEGIHPDTSVLEDPLNPFADDVPFGDRKWDIESSGASAVLKFYSWASILAVQATGENQFYTAATLHAIYDQGLAVQEDLPNVRVMAIDAYQAVLDHFPDDVTFDATVTFSFGLATPAYNGIIELGGAPQGGWRLVDSNAGPIAIQTP